MESFVPFRVSVIAIQLIVLGVLPGSDQRTDTKHKLELYFKTFVYLSNSFVVFCWVVRFTVCTFPWHFFVSCPFDFTCFFRLDVSTKKRHANEFFPVSCIGKSATAHGFYKFLEHSTQVAS